MSGGREFRVRVGARPLFVRGGRQLGAASFTVSIGGTPSEHRPNPARTLPSSARTEAPRIRAPTTLCALAHPTVMRGYVRNRGVATPSRAPRTPACGQAASGWRTSPGGYMYPGITQSATFAAATTSIGRRLTARGGHISTCPLRPQCAGNDDAVGEAVVAPQRGPGPSTRPMLDAAARLLPWSVWPAQSLPRTWSCSPRCRSPPARRGRLAFEPLAVPCQTPPPCTWRPAAPPTPRSTGVHVWNNTRTTFRAFLAM